MNPRSRLDTLLQTHPEWSPWLGVLRPLIDDLIAAPPDTGARATAGTFDRPVQQPMLATATLQPDPLAVAGLMKRLNQAACTHGLQALVGSGGAAGDTGAPARSEEVEGALAVFLAAVNGDQAALDAQAALRGATPEGFRALADLLPMPFLHVCARQWAASPAAPWSQGHCPVCAAWPVLAELRGIARTRHLRCGRCAASWAMPQLICTYCATSDHDKLGTLVTADARSPHAVDVCRVCSGYLKTCTTLQAIPAQDILLADLASVAFDLAALERGFRRPRGLAVALGARLQTAALPASPAALAQGGV